MKSINANWMDFMKPKVQVNYNLWNGSNPVSDGVVRLEVEHFCLFINLWNDIYLDLAAVTVRIIYIFKFVFCQEMVGEVFDSVFSSSVPVGIRISHGTRHNLSHATPQQVETLPTSAWKEIKVPPLYHLISRYESRRWSSCRYHWRWVI